MACVGTARWRAPLAATPSLDDAPEEALWRDSSALPRLLERCAAIREGASPGALGAEPPGTVPRARVPHAAHCMSAHGIAASTARPATSSARAACSGSTGQLPFPSHRRGAGLRGTQVSRTIFFTSCNTRCAFCQNGDIRTDKDNGEETDPRTLAAMAWTLRREGCHNINWVGGEVVIHLHAIVDAIALLGRDFTPTQAELARARKTKADRFFWFDEVRVTPSMTGSSMRRCCGTATSSSRSRA